MSMMERAGLYLRRARASYGAVCEREWIVCPEEETRTPPAIYRPNELDRIVGVPPDTSFDHEMQRVRGGTRRHRATRAYVLADAEIRSGYLCKGAVKWKLSDLRDIGSGDGRMQWHPRLALGCTLTSNRYFGHWLTDGLALKLLASGVAPTVTTGESSTRHAGEYSEIFNLRPRAVSRARIGELTVFDDVGQNAGKRDRFRRLRELARAAVKKTGGERTSPPLGVMLLRGTTGERRMLVNEQAIAEHLERRGFIIIDPERTSARDILRSALDARIVISVEGSQIVHGLFPLAEGGAVLALQPPARFNNVFKDYTDAMDLHYGFSIGKPEADGFSIDLDELDRLLDRVETRVLM